MATVSTATTNFDKTVQVLISKTLEALLRAGLEYLPSGAVVPAKIVPGSNGTFRFNRIADLDATPASHTLSEGTPPSGQDLDFGYEEFTGDQYGDFVNLTDLAMKFSPHSLAGVTAERVARQMAAIVNTIAKDLFDAGTNDIFSGTGNTQVSDVAAGDVLLSSDVKRGVALLEGTNVPRFAGNAFRGVIHPYVKFDLQLDDDAGGWIDASRYADAGNFQKGELGKYAGVRFVVTSDAIVETGEGTSAIDVYKTTIMGSDCIAFGDLSTQEVIIERGGVSDPLHQVETVGWKCFVGGMLIGEGDNATVVGDPRYINISSASSIG